MKRDLAVFCLLLIVKFSAGQANKLNFSLLAQNDHIDITEPSSVYLKWKSPYLINDKHSLVFGGAYRFQTEGFINEQFDKDADQTDLWLLNRIMFHTRYQFNPYVTIFGELSSATIASKESPSPVDEDQLALNQAFVEFKLNKWKLLVGRQNMRLGSGRLVDIREGPNVRLSFDMAELNYLGDKNTIKFFHAIPVYNRAEVFNNKFLHGDESFSGIYYSQFNSKEFGFDLYLFRKFERSKVWDKGVGNDDRYSVGFRGFGNLIGFNYDLELVYQYGDFANNRIRAYTASIKLWRDFEVQNKGILTFGLSSELISGDKDANDNRLNTFDGLYPRGAYFGRVARFGPSNLVDVHPWIAYKVGVWEFSFDYVAFWRYSIEDGLYNPALILEYPDLNDKRFFAHQLGTISGVKMNSHIYLELETNWIIPEGFLFKAELDDSLFHSVITLDTRF